MRVVFGEHVAPALPVVADQVFHFRAVADDVGAAERQAADGADVVFELRGYRAFDRPVAAVVHARGHFVEDGAVGADEEFQRQDADMVERGGHPSRQRRGFGPLRGDFRRGGDGRGGQDAARVDVARGGVADAGAVIELDALLAGMQDDLPDERTNVA